MKMKSLFMLLSAATMLFCAASCGNDKDDDDSNNGGGGGNAKSTLTVSPTRDITFNAIDNNEMIFTVSTNAKTGWNTEATPDWIVVTAKTDRNLKIKVTENTGPERTHALTFIAEGAEPVSVAISQKSGESTFPSLTGSDYYVISLDKESEVAIAGKITVDYRNQYEFQVWNGYTGGNRTGLNFYGLDQQWVCLAWGSGWAGAGYLAKVPVDWSGLTRDHVLHFAVKGSGTHILRVGDGNQYHVALGGEYKDGDVTYQPAVELTDEWREVEIPVSKMLDEGWALYKQDEFPKNMMSIGSVTGEPFEINLDAIFFYKPKSKE